MRLRQVRKNLLLVLDPWSNKQIFESGKVVRQLICSALYQCGVAGFLFTVVLDPQRHPLRLQVFDGAVPCSSLMKVTTYHNRSIR